MAPRIAASKSIAAISTGRIKPLSLKSLRARGVVVGASGLSEAICQEVLVTVKIITPSNTAATIKAGMELRPVPQKLNEEKLTYEFEV